MNEKNHDRINKKKNAILKLKKKSSLLFLRAKRMKIKEMVKFIEEEIKYCRWWLFVSFLNVLFLKKEECFFKSERFSHIHRRHLSSKRVFLICFNFMKWSLFGPFTNRWPDFVCHYAIILHYRNLLKRIK